MIIVPFKCEHLDCMVVQDAQQSPWVKSEQYKSLENDFAYSGFDGDDCLISAGIVEMWPGRAQAWAVLGTNARKHMKSITRSVARMLNIAPWRRIEITVDCNFKEAHRWARMLGFKKEAERMVGYLPDGRDVALYARVR